jgi:hypothetical protein
VSSNGRNKRLAILHHFLRHELLHTLCIARGALGTYEQGVVALTADIAEDRTRSSPGVSYLWAWVVRATAQVANDGIVLHLVAVRESGKAEGYRHVAVEVEVVGDPCTEHPSQHDCHPVIVRLPPTVMSSKSP